MATMEEMQDKLEKLTTELRNREIYFPPKEKKIKPFNGSDGAPVGDFVEDVRAGIKLRRLRGENAVDYVLAHLEGAARQELKHRPDKEKGDAKSILKILLETFGDRLTLGQLMRQVYNRTQKEDESVAEYGYALLSLSTRMEGRAGAPDAEKAIKEQFQDGLSDAVLRREVKRLVKEKPQLSFIEIRDWAVEMEEGEKMNPLRRKKGTVYHADATVEMGKMVEGLTAAIRSQTDVLERMKTQQGEFNTRLQRLEDRREGSAGQRPPFDVRRVECYRCGNRGHFARNCPNPPAFNRNMPPSPGAQQFPQQGNLLHPELRAKHWVQLQRDVKTAQEMRDQTKLLEIAPQQG